MEALFIVPAMVSPQVNEKLIPALSKMIERNVLLNNASLFKKAAMVKYEREGAWKKVNESSDIPVVVISDGIINEDESYLHNMGKFILEAKDPWSEGPKDNRSPNQKAYDKLKKTAADKRYEREQTKADIAQKRADARTKNRQYKNGEFSDYLDRQRKDSEIDKNRADANLKQAEARDREAARQAGSRSRSAELDYKSQHTFSSQDQIEHPSGIKFFSQISLEPTILEIPLYMGRHGIDERGFMVKVGVKCIPYVIDDVKSMVNLLDQSANLGWFERQFKLLFRKINTKIWFTRRRKINKGDLIDPKEAAEAITYSPNRNELTDTKTLVNKFSNNESGNWSTMIVLSHYDLEQDDALVKVVNNYRKLTKYVIGDLVITNEAKESAYFCTPRLNHCQEIPFSYLNKVLNLKDVLDYSEASRASAWKKETNAKNTSARSLKENKNYDSVKNKVNDILNG